jgi:hypothetical protein
LALVLVGGGFWPERAQERAAVVREVKRALDRAGEFFDQEQWDAVRAEAGRAEALLGRVGDDEKTNGCGASSRSNG